MHDDHRYAWSAARQPARSATVFLVASKSRTLEVLAFDEYFIFDISAFKTSINRGSLYTAFEIRSIHIKSELFIER